MAGQLTIDSGDTAWMLMSTALVKTAEYRFPRPGKLEEIIFYDHPSVETRVRRSMEWKAAHPEPPTP